MARLSTGSREVQFLTRHCWDTVENLMSSETILGALTDWGFREVVGATRFGLLSEYVGRKL